MRCSGLKEELRSLASTDLPSKLSSESRQHLETCAECQAEVERLGDFGELFQRASQLEDLEVPLFTEMRESVRQRSNSRLAAPTERRFAWRLNKLTTPRLGLALATLAVAFGVYAVSSLTKPSDTGLVIEEAIVGYEVTFAGVQKELAEDPESICDLLSALELFEANIDSVSCESTCQLSIIDLQSVEDAGLVIEAFSRLGNGYYSAEVVPVTAIKSAS